MAIPLRTDYAAEPLRAAAKASKDAAQARRLLALASIYLVDYCCNAWNKLVDQPWTIMSLGLRDWAYRF